jgi:hypothetical protein
MGAAFTSYLLLKVLGSVFVPIPWQKKLVAPLIANLIGYLQCKDRVTKVKERRQLQAT